MSIALRVRRATPRDSAGILDCLGKAFEQYRNHYTELAFSDTVLTPESLGRRHLEMHILVAADTTNHILGTIAYKAANGEGHIRGMAVLPEHQGSGIAASLLAQAEADLRRLHCRSVTLDTTAPLSRAICFYEKNGFHRTGKAASFFGMDLFEYRKKL